MRLTMQRDDRTLFEQHERFGEFFGCIHRVDFPPLERFDTEANHRRFPRTALGKLLYEEHRAWRMAGCALRPPFVEFCEWLRCEGLSATQRGFIGEFVEQAQPVNWSLLVRNSGASTHEVVRTLIACRVDRATPAGFAFPRRLPNEPVPLRIRMARWMGTGCGESPGGLKELWHLADEII